MSGIHTAPVPSAGSGGPDAALIALAVGLIAAGFLVPVCWLLLLAGGMAWLVRVGG